MKRPTSLSLLIIKIAVIVVAIFIVPLAQSLGFELNLLREAMAWKSEMLIPIALLYALMLAVPFFPGFEVGLLLMHFFSLPGIIVVYLATLLGLSLAFITGQSLSRYGFHTNFIKRLLSSQTIGQLAWHSPLFFMAVLINIPGNVIVGGGGGIAMSYGLLNKVTLAQFLGAAAVAVSPVPLLFAFGLKI